MHMDLVSGSLGARRAAGCDRIKAFRIYNNTFVIYRYREQITENGIIITFR